MTRARVAAMADVFTALGDVFTALGDVFTALGDATARLGSAFLSASEIAVASPRVLMPAVALRDDKAFLIATDSVLASARVFRAVGGAPALGGGETALVLERADFIA